MSFWEVTKAALEPLISHPPLTEKNLSRPPFRFIHDIISNINQTHGTFQGVFPPEFEDSGSIDSKEKKIQYLELLVGAVERGLGKPVSVNVKKIVTGSEVESTNVFLQQIAELVQMSVTGLDAPPPPPPPPPPVADDDEAPPPPPPPPLVTEGEEASPLPPGNHSNLPVRKAQKAVNPLLDAVKLRLKNVSEEFRGRVAIYGFDASPEALPASRIVKDVSAMEKDLADSLETEPSKMPEAALAIAIQRQLEAILQVSSLIDDNNAICNQLVEQMMGALQ